MEDQREQLNKSIEEINKATQTLGKERGVNLQQLSSITSDTLTGGERPVTVPETPTSTSAAGLSAYATSVGEQEKERARIQAEQEAKVAEAQAGASEEKERIRSLMDQVLGVQSERATLEESSGIGEKAQRVTTYTNQLESLERAELNELRSLEGSGLTDIQKSQRQREISRRYAFEKADVALLQSAANRDLETSQNIINRKIELQLEPILTQLDFTKFFYQENKADLTKAEGRAFDLKISELDRQYEETKTLETYKAGLVTTAIQNGVNIPSYVLNELTRAKSQEEAAQVLASNGISLQSTNQRLQDEKLRLEIDKARVELKDTIDTGKVATGEYGSVINTASNLLGSEKAKQSRKDIASAIADGDYVTAYANISNNVEQALTGEVKTRFANQRNDYAAMVGLRTAIQEYADGGGDMGLLKGTEESIKRKLGIDSSSASVLAVQLWREFQNYRNVMTGAAFSASESADYASVNPTLNKSLDLNMSVIDGAMNQLENRIVSTIETRVPGAKNLYQKITPEESMTDDEAYQLYLEAQQLP